MRKKKLLDTLEELTRQNREAQDKLRQSERRQSALEAENESLKQSLAQLETRLNEKKQEAAQLYEEKQKCQTQLYALQGERAERNTVMLHLQQQYAAAAAELSGTAEREAALAGEIAQLRSELTVLSQKYEALREENRRISELSLEGTEAPVEESADAALPPEPASPAPHSFASGSPAEFSGTPPEDARIRPESTAPGSTPDNSSSDGVYRARITPLPAVPDALLPEPAPPARPVSKEDIDWGAKAIGQVVALSTSLSGKISGTKDAAAKELLALALGQTEVFKSEVLAIIRSEDSHEMKSKKIKALMEETLDYYHSIEGQLK